MLPSVLLCGTATLGEGCVVVLCCAVVQCAAAQLGVVEGSNLACPPVAVAGCLQRGAVAVFLAGVGFCCRGLCAVVHCLARLRSRRGAAAAAEGWSIEYSREAALTSCVARATHAHKPTVCWLCTFCFEHIAAYPNAVNGDARARAHAHMLSILPISCCAVGRLCGRRARG